VYRNYCFYANWHLSAMLSTTEIRCFILTAIIYWSAIKCFEFWLFLLYLIHFFSHFIEFTNFAKRDSLRSGLLTNTQTHWQLVIHLLKLEKHFKLFSDKKVQVQQHGNKNMFLKFFFFICVTRPDRWGVPLIRS